MYLTEGRGSRYQKQYAVGWNELLTLMGLAQTLGQSQKEAAAQMNCPSSNNAWVCVLGLSLHL
jgi:hypothetical protein